MPERSLNKRSVQLGPVMPTPVSPMYSISDVWEVEGLSTKTWEYDIPDDSMLYKLCNYNHSMIPTGWVISAVSLNGDTIFYSYSGYTIIWSPGSSSAPKFMYPDVLTIELFHPYASYSVSHYWQMDFWREWRGI
jgi:hypothetical protein